MILVAGPYRSGTNDDPVLIAGNVAAMTEASLRLFRAGHLPVMSEWCALPLIGHVGPIVIGDPVFDEIFHPIARRVFFTAERTLLARLRTGLAIGAVLAGYLLLAQP